MIKLPDVVDEGAKPDFLSDDWEWSEETDAWERHIGDKVIVYLYGYFCTFDVDNVYYSVELYDFVMDEAKKLNDEEKIQQTLDVVFGYTGGSIEKNYSLDDDLAALRDEILEPWVCQCGHDEFYAVVNKGLKMYGCTNPRCDIIYGAEEIPTGVVVNVNSITTIEE